jgi:ADP-heptose:LPS heptosyltransferase
VQELSIRVVKHLIKKPILRAISVFGRAVEKHFNKELQKDKIDNILVFCLGGIGDKLLVFPAISALRTDFPDAKLYIITDSGGHALFKLYPSDSMKLLSFNMTREHKSLARKFMFMTSIRRISPIDLVYNPHRGRGMIEHTVMSFLTGARYRIGFTGEGTGFLYTSKVDFSLTESILKQNILLLDHAYEGAQGNSHITITIPPEDMAFAEGFLDEHDVCGGDLIIAIHPTAEWEPMLKCWPKANYVNLIKQLSGAYERVKIVVFGSARDRSAVQPLLEETRGPNVIDAVGKTSIPQMAALIRCSDAFIGNDSGPLHIAVALNVPAIGIFGATCPEQVIPSGGKNCIMLRKNLPCGPCYVHQPFFTPGCRDARCLSLISVSDVMHVLESLLNG